MTTTTTPPVPLPPGATEASTWEAWDNEFRIVRTGNHLVDGHNATVSASAVQFPDGRIEDSGDDEPQIWVDSPAFAGLTTVQARQFAAQLLEVADIVDSWVAR